MAGSLCGIGDALIFWQFSQRPDYSHSDQSVRRLSYFRAEGSEKRGV
jgi:hypothetical protein